VSYVDIIIADSYDTPAMYICRERVGHIGGLPAHVFTLMFIM